MELFPEPDWTVLLLCGASGVGKTHVSYRLAHHYGAGLTEVDDFQTVLEHMTSAEQHPVFHYWRTHVDEAIRMSEDQHVAFYQGYATAMEEPLALVIANHLESRTPIILEGDFILPSLALQPQYGQVPSSGRVRAVVLFESDEHQIADNYRSREGEDQPLRARMSWLISEWLRREAERWNIPTVPARPWETVLERVIAAVDQGEISTWSADSPA